MYFCWIFLFRSYVAQICSVGHDGFHKNPRIVIAVKLNGQIEEHI